MQSQSTRAFTFRNSTSSLAVLGVAAAIAACQPAGAAPSPDTASRARVEPAEVSRDAVASPESLRVGDAVLRGTLLRPAAPAPATVALIIAGSGPTDRDGNSAILPGKNNALKMLAEGLAAHGIASLRYDKRGIAASSVGVFAEQDLTFGTYVDDAAAWGRQLAADARFTDVVVVGHSEGGLLAIMSAAHIPATRVVSIAGLGRPAGIVLREQLGRQISGEMMSTADSILTVLERGGRVQNVTPALQVLFRESVQPYLSSFLVVDPAVEVARLDVPVLVIHGSTDEQIARADADALAAASPRAELRVFEGMSHVLKPAPPGLAQQAAAYTDSTIALAPGLVDTIAAFIRRR
jgi:uncharacterized protein